MKSYHLNTWKVKIWLSQEQKELSKWNKKTFLLVSQVLSFRYSKQTSNNVVTSISLQKILLHLLKASNTIVNAFHELKVAEKTDGSNKLLTMLAESAALLGLLAI